MKWTRSAVIALAAAIFFISLSNVSSAAESDSSNVGKQPAGSSVAPGNYSLTVTDRDKVNIRFKVVFGGKYTLTANGGDLQVVDSSGRVVDSVKPKISTQDGRTLTGSFAVQAPDRFTFTYAEVASDKPTTKLFRWGSFLCGVTSTISGTVGGAFLGGPLGAGFGLGTGIAAAATC